MCFRTYKETFNTCRYDTDEPLQSESNCNYYGFLFFSLVLSLTIIVVRGRTLVSGEKTVYEKYTSLYKRNNKFGQT